MMRLELVDTYGLKNYYYSVLGVMCDEKRNLHIMKEGYTYFVSNSQYKTYAVFLEIEEEEDEICSSTH